MLLDIGTEEIDHVEMLATMIAQLLETSPETQGDAARNSFIGAIMGGSRIEDVIVAGMNPQHAIVSGRGRDADRQRRSSVDVPLHQRERQPARRFPLQRHCGIPGATAGRRACMA